VTTVKVPDAELSALAGVYWSPLSDEVVRAEVKDGALRRVGAPAGFVAFGDGIFRMAATTEEWRFTAGTPRELRIFDFWPTPRIFTRVTAVMPAASALVQLTGQYQSNEVEMTFTVHMVDGKLTLQWPRQSSIALEAIGGDRFVGTLGTVTFTRTASGAVDGLTISNRRLRRLRLERLAQ
jgi:hypothetical protein